jgi:hypothetical protein
VRLLMHSHSLCFLSDAFENTPCNKAVFCTILFAVDNYTRFSPSLCEKFSSMKQLDNWIIELTCSSKLCLTEH